MDLKNIAVVQDENDGGLLGYLTWYSISESLFSRETLKDGLKNAGLGEEWMPKEIRLPDAFRRATKAIECKRYSDQEGIHYNFLIREVAYDDTMIQRNIVCETVDKNGRRLSYDPSAAILVLNKETGEIDVTSFNNIAEELAQDAVAHFHQFRDNYNSQAVRQLVYSVIKSTSATPVRPSGGIYFVPIRYESRLKSLCDFLNGLKDAKGIRVPVINTQEGKDMIREGLKDHLQSVLATIHNGIKENRPKHHLKPILEDAKKVVADFKEYEAILQDEVENMRVYIDLIRRQVKVLMDKMTE
ncbi:hypothetical protein QO009_002987 [Brevibacillus aydinogluensis]|jgi:hypothetical protein|uniref:DUF6744 family protein n=1 Tax=Brevibacillus aydinogluensis TaxID=927786 RepID=UPI002893697F|nr:DUF6744 family protein [Brevibacillus aydinogluensis]MDT3417092.1 hypothetical protein [Brevibacillus aydinogluensis]